MSENVEKKLVIGITLKGDDVRKFRKVQESRSLSQDAQTVRVLIRDSYKNLKKKKK